MSIPVPAKIGKYAVVDVIGRGGMGVVYECNDPHLSRRVAIKMITGILAENPDMLKRFTREAQSVACLQHPNIVTLFDLGTEDGIPYLVMEYLTGETLETALTTRRQMSLLDKLTIIVQVCHGLGYVHRRGVVHRDIKPANIMLSNDGGIKIFDFGIARAGDQNVTRTGEVIGTLNYMAPEQVNSRTADFRADIFSTGVVLYQLITNHLPFQGDNTAATILKIVHEPPPPLSTFLSAFPPPLEQILQRAMAKSPQDRYQSADDFAFDLEDLLGQLKEELLGREMQAASSCLDRGDVYEAQGTLMRALKVDPQHSGAVRLMREVQQRIQRYEIEKKTQELRDLAEKALATEHFEEAQEQVDRALALDRQNTGLKELRETIVAASARATKLRSALDSAQAAQSDGHLDEALKAAEEALAVAPDNSQARTLARLIARDIEDRSRHNRMEDLLQDARKLISSRNFTGALDILKEAEELDPTSPHVHSLAETAVAGRENERRRKELDVLVREIEQALDHDDFPLASEKAGEAAARFPQDQNLLKLKSLADRQRLWAERKQMVEEQLILARQLLQAGRKAELKDRLEQAIQQIGPDSRLQSLLATVTDELGRQRREEQKSEGLERASESMSNSDFDGAVQTLEELKGRIGDDTEVREMLARATRDLESARAQQAPTRDLNVSTFSAAFSSSEQSGPSRQAEEAETTRIAEPPPGHRLAEVQNDNPPEMLNVTVAAAAGGQTISAPSVTPMAPVQPETVSDVVNAERLQLIERQLAAFIGPLARVLVKRAAARTTSVLELYDLLAADLEKDDDRRAFLARRTEVLGKDAKIPVSRPVAANPALDSPAGGAAREEITPAAVDQAAHFLAAHLGPIANVLARKEAKRAASLRDFYAQLAEHVADLAEREQFLKATAPQSGLRR